MAGETQKTTALTNRDSSSYTSSRLASGSLKVGMDTHQFAAATELEAADNLITNISLPSNAIVHEISIYNDDMDTDACPTLVLDIGVAAGEDYTDVTSSSATKHYKDDIIDADLFVDGSTEGQAANTSWTILTPDSGTFGPEDALKPVWELLGYDEDPQTQFNIVVQSQAASAALAAAADFAIKVVYSVD